MEFNEKDFLFGMSMLFPNGRSKALTLSYDDGVCQDERFIKTIDKHGLLATFNLNSALLDLNSGDRCMGKEKTISLYKNSKHEVALHGSVHANLERLPQNLIAKEILLDRIGLENAFDRQVRGMAFAYGRYTKESLDAMKLSGIVYSRTTKSTGEFNVYHGDEWLTLHPTCHHNDPKLFELCDNFLSYDGKKGAAMFYVWGHTYEFDRNDNWDVIEKFAEKMGGRDDIWYATNIDIYDYVLAYDRLIVSMNGKMITNPSAVPVWVSVRFKTWQEDQKTVRINPGETVRL